VEIGPQGKKRARRAEAIRPTHVGQPRSSPPRKQTASLFAIPAFLTVYVATGLLWRHPPWLALVYLIASAIAFVAYALDKSAAKNGTWRTSESTLHVLAIAGGWPGALLAQQLLRH